ncbi:MAG: HAMP domain-containing protein [Proteobacteria bacterium]|nr:HAMP domain-containing protein [Pseudomonadota bacterium]
MRALLANFRIKSKLLLLAGISIAGFALIGGIVAYQESVTGRATEMREVGEARATGLLALDSLMLQLRRHEKDFLLRRDLKYAASHGEAVAEVGKALARLKGMSSSANMAGYDRLSAGVSVYAKTFESLVATMKELGLNQNEGQQAVMRAAVRDAEESLNKLGQDPIVILVLQLRRNEKDFQLRETQAEVDAHMANTAKLKALLANASFDPTQRQKIEAETDQYAKSFADLVRLAFERNAKTAELSKDYTAVDSEIEKVLANERADIAKSLDAVATQLALARTVLWTAVAAVAGVVIVLSLLIAGFIATPITQITRQMERLGGGDVEIAADVVGKDEVAEMGRSLLVFRDNLVAQRELEAQAARQQQAQLERAQRVAAITDEFQTGVAEVLDTTSKSVSALEVTAKDLTRISSNAQELSVAAATGSNEASSNVQTVAAATEELTASIKEISRQIATSSESANRTATLAASSETRVRELSEVAVRIGDVVKLINSIASQTNLLALNATIEAARAGDAGKGFAVVANEVKTLASQTAKATEEIGAQVTAIQEKTGGVVTAMADIGVAIRGISEMTATIASAVEEQTAATQEIGRNVEQAAQGVEETNRAITGVRSAAEETGVASGGVLRASGDVAGQADALSKRVTLFLDAVRAA